MTKQKIKLGDAIAKLTKILGIKHCSKCEKRREILNNIEGWDVKDIIGKLKNCCNEK